MHSTYKTAYIHTDTHCSVCAANIQQRYANSGALHTKYLPAFPDFTDAAGATVSETYLESFIVLQQKKFLSLKPTSCQTKTNKT